MYLEKFFGDYFVAEIHLNEIGEAISILSEKLIFCVPINKYGRES